MNKTLTCSVAFCVMNVLFAAEKSSQEQLQKSQEPQIAIVPIRRELTIEEREAIIQRLKERSIVGQMSEMGSRELLGSRPHTNLE